MPDRCVLQPNGMYARFSTTCNHFTEYNCTETEILSVFSEIHGHKTAVRKVNNAKLEWSRFDEAIRTIGESHGLEESAGIRKILTDPFSPSVRIDGGEPPQAETNRATKSQTDRSLPPELSARIKDICMEESRLFRLAHPRYHAPLVSAERRLDIELFARTIKLVEEAYGLKLKGDTDLSGDILIFDQRNTLPRGYDFSAYIEPNGALEISDWVLDDEIAMDGKSQ